MKIDKEAWRDIANVANSGLKDLLESILVCLTVFMFFAFLGFVGNLELYANIMKKVVGAVIMTTFGLRMSNEIKKSWFTICICMLIALNIATSVILVIMNILSYF